MRPGCHGTEAKSASPCRSGNGSPKLWRLIATLALLLPLKTLAQDVQPIELHAISLSNSADATNLPDSPGAAWTALAVSQTALQQPQQNPNPSSNPPPTPGATAPPCAPRPHRRSYPRFRRDPCDPYRPFVDAPLKPLTPEQKGYLAIHDVVDPFNLLTITATSAFTIGINSHTAYGPGMRGFGYNVGTSFSQDVTGEAIGTYAVCSLFHEDPRYFRMPHATIPRRLWHAIARLGVAQGDNGHTMPNYQNLITSVAGAVIANQYVPGLATDPASTTERILTGFLTEPIGPIIAEFLPDLASHIHVRILVVQRLLNQIEADGRSQ